MVKMVQERRLGRFHIPHHILEAEPATAVAILDGCLVVRASESFEFGCIEYVAYHEDFAPTAKGELLRMYRAVVTRIGPIHEPPTHIGRTWEV